MGPLHGIRIVEIAGIGPGQFCGMLLADMGARLIRIERPARDAAGIRIPERFNLMNRSRPAIALDLKSRRGVDLVLRLCAHADALYEGFRPGVMERLGLGPDACMAVNHRLVYGRMTGWGQDGPLAASAGHDGNYAALAGIIGAIGERDRPPSLPLNLTADFGGGGAYLAIGLLAALLESQRSGSGQVVDVAMVDGAASLMTLFYGLHAGGLWRDRRGSNFLDGAAPYYRAYRTSDAQYLVVCAIEAPFFRALLDSLGIDDIDPVSQHDTQCWPQQIRRFESVFARRTRDEWCALFDGSDACVAPVLSLTEAPQHPHNQARDTFVNHDGVLQPAPAPRFSRTPAAIASAPAKARNEVRAALAEWGLPDTDIAELVADR